jgi:hypothetical protein
MLFNKYYWVVDVVFVVFSQLLELFLGFLSIIILLQALLIFKITKVFQQYFLPSSSSSELCFKISQVVQVIGISIFSEVFINNKIKIICIRCEKIRFLTLMMNFAFIR